MIYTAKELNRICTLGELEEKDCQHESYQESEDYYEELNK